MKKCLCEPTKESQLNYPEAGKKWNKDYVHNAVIG